jgi:hypothetical protein
LRPSSFSKTPALILPWLPLSTIDPSVKRIACRIVRHSGMAAQQKLEVHAEVLELLGLRVLHDCAGFGILLDGQTLLIPVNRLGLLNQREDHAR